MSSILVVDDSRLARVIARKYLEELGHDVQEAGSVSDAWALLRGQTFDLVLLDWNMPGGNGLELAQLLEQEEATRNIRVVFATSEVDIVHQAYALEAGAQAYLTKPYTAEQLSAVIDKVLGA